jgi:hypothetical protein
MQITLLEGCDRAWREALTQWQESELAALYRQGRHLPDRTDHGADKRWAQAGVKTRDTYGRWRRTPDDHYAHERVLVKPREFGYTLVFVRRTTAYAIDVETGGLTAHTVWSIVDTWHVGRCMSANYETSRLGVMEPARN